MPSLRLLRFRLRRVLAGLAILLAASSIPRLVPAYGEEPVGNAVDGVVDTVLRKLTGREPKVNAEQLKQFEDHFSAILKKVAASELLFFEKVCEPDAKQTARIREASLAATKSQAKELARMAASGRSASGTDPRARISAALRKAAVDILPAEAIQRYDSELAEREASRKVAALGMMMTLIDRKLSLTKDQYDRVEDEMGKKWNEQWSRNPLVFMYGDYAPMPDANTLGPFLTAKQKAIWESRANMGQIGIDWQNEFQFFQNDAGEILELEEAVDAPAAKVEVRVISVPAAAIEVKVEAKAADDKPADEKRAEPARKAEPSKGAK